MPVRMQVRGSWVAQTRGWKFESEDWEAGLAAIRFRIAYQGNTQVDAPQGAAIQ